MESDNRQAAPQELTTSRARFIAELPERLSTLRQGLSRLSNQADQDQELNALRRRVHALAAAADVLGFGAAARALGVAESALSGSANPGAPARERVARILDVLPALAFGVSLELEFELELAPTLGPHAPCLALVFGAASLAALLHKAGPLHAVEAEATADPEAFLEAAARRRPDVLIVDGDEERVNQLVPRLRKPAGPGSGDPPIIAVGNFEQHEPLVRLVRRGACRVLPKPLDALILQRAVRRLGAPAPLDVETAPSRARTPSGLLELIQREARRAFAGVFPAEREPALEFASGGQVMALLWGAFARLHGLATPADGRQALPALRGPYGVIPLAPAAPEPAAQREAGGARSSPESSPALAGRTIVVAAGDLSSLTLYCRALEQLGAKVKPARSAAAARELVERHWPDALLSDALLPDLDGFELARRMRADIALWDLPIALVVWKDYVSERARSADAATFDAESLAPELARCLASRAELEHHLARHAGAAGRIDGQSTRLLLEAACRTGRDSVLSCFDARARFELVCSGGRLVDARLYDGAHLASEGEAVLLPFLGLRSGRFKLEPLAAAPEPRFRGELMDVLEPELLRARRAAERLASAEGLHEIERCELDRTLTAHYLQEARSAPESAVRALAEGTPLPVLLGSRGSRERDPSEIAAALNELARRGAVRGLVDRSGRDLLAGEGTAPAGGSAGGGAVADLSEAVLEALEAPAAESRPDTVDDRPVVARSESVSLGLPSAGEQVSLEVESEAPSRARRRLPSAAAPFAITLGAALLAFAVLRAIGGNSQRVEAIWPASAPALPDAGSARTPPAPAPAPVEPPAEQAGEEAESASLLAERSDTARKVSFETELLDLPLHTKVRPGHGLLEVHTWQPRPIYVDGVFMGNYAARLIPLGPGTYQLRLGNGDQSLERSVEVQAGRRTRLVARLEATR